MKTRDKLAARRTELEAKEAELARLEPVLRALGLEAGLSEIEGLDCIRMAERFERRLEEIARAWEKSRDARDALRRSAPASRGSESRSPPTPPPSSGIGVVVGSSPSPLSVLKPTRRIEGAETALEVWDKASNDGENHRNRMRRVVGIQRNMNDFETEAHALIQRCAPTRRGPAGGGGRAPVERASCRGADGSDKASRGGRAEGDGSASAR